MLMNTRSYGLTNLSLHHSDSVTAQNSLTFTEIFFCSLLFEYLYFLSCSIPDSLRDVITCSAMI